MAAFRRRNSDRYNTIYEQAVKLPIEFICCRIWGHRWSDEVEVNRLDRNHNRLFNTCERCDSQNWKDWTLRGSQVASGISYPKGYCFEATGVLETADRDILRVVYMDLISSAGDVAEAA